MWIGFTDLGEEALDDYGYTARTASPPCLWLFRCYQEIAHCIDKTIVKIENAVLSDWRTPLPEPYADIVKNGIYLAGGGYCPRIGKTSF